MAFITSDFSRTPKFSCNHHQSGFQHVLCTHVCMLYSDCLLYLFGPMSETSKEEARRILPIYHWKELFMVRRCGGAVWGWCFG